MTKERARMVGNLTKKNKKCQMPGGQPRGGGMGTLGIDSYIKKERTESIMEGSRYWVLAQSTYSFFDIM